MINLSDFKLFDNDLNTLKAHKLLINTLNAHSFNVAQKDAEFAEALLKSDVLIPDGISVVWAARFLDRAKIQEPRTKRLKKIAGEDLFYFEMKRLQQLSVNSYQSTVIGEQLLVNSYQSAVNGEQLNSGKRPRAFFLGSTEDVLDRIKARAAREFPDVEVYTYSPPYKPEFTEEDNRAMYAAINAVNPDVLFVGMTAPKQEKWAYKAVNSGKLIIDRGRIDNEQLIVDSESVSGHDLTCIIQNEDKHTDTNKTGEKELLIINYELLIDNCHVCCIGAVFDFYGGTVTRAPRWLIKMGLEWFYRLVMEPRRMWKRYLIGNLKFMGYVLRELVQG